MTRTFFTITAGRTGTTWLAEFFAKNLNGTSIHEPLAIEDFGVNMPDIRVMRSFNEYGNNDEVKNFWKRKFNNIKKFETYSETNHTLAKCGLIENLVESDLANYATVVILKRDIVRVSASFILRGSFHNISNIWQFLLQNSYKNNLVKSNIFMEMGVVGYALWYCYEMEARQLYYKLLYGERVKMIEVVLDDIVTDTGCHEFWHEICYEKTKLLLLNTSLIVYHYHC